jgi:hypothetical protein
VNDEREKDALIESDSNSPSFYVEGEGLMNNKYIAKTYLYEWHC